MANEIDERVVSMKFDNTSFQTKVSGTIAALQKLKESLNFGNSTKSLADLNSAANSVNLSGIASAVDSVNSKFSAMGVVAFTVLSGITTAAMSAGASIIKSLTLAPLIQGFQEYETNMNSIQTILANTKSDGSSLADVNGALDQLNTYSDKTIYNFSQMARNIGTFTAAGVGLQESVNAIKGVANLAAISGSSSEQASTAMYQLSQALAAGKVNLMDWNSVVNAGMGGEVFKKALFETGKALGKINDVPLGATFEEWEKQGGTFREQMSEGWLTSDVLSTTLSAFSGDLDAATLSAMGFSDAAAAQMVELGKLGIESATRVKTATQLMGTIKETIGSGFAQSFRMIIGDFEEAPKLFTSINDAIGNFVGKLFDAQHALLGVWRFLGGREKLIEAFTTAFRSLGSIMGKISDAFREVFPAKTGAQLAMMTSSFAALMERLKPSEQLLNTIKAGFKAFFSVISIGVEVLRYIGRTFKIFFNELNDANGGQVLTFLGEFAYKIIKLKETLVDGGVIRDFFVKYIYPIANFLGNLNIAGAIGTLGELLGSLFSTIKGFFGGESVDGEAITSVVDRVGERFGWLATVVEKLGELGNWLRGKLSTIGDAFKELLGKIADVFSGADTDMVFDALNTGLLAGLALLVRQFMKDGFKFDLGSSGMFDKIGQSFEQLTGVFTAMQQNLKADMLMKIAIAIGILTASVLVLSMIDSAALTKALVAVATGFGILIGAMALLTKATAGIKSSASFSILALGLIALAAAMLIFSLAVKILSTMEIGDLAKGLVGVMVLLAAVTIAVKNMPKPKELISAGIGIIAIAAGVLILSLAVGVLGSMDLGTMVQGLAGIAVVLGILIATLHLMPDEKKVLATAVSMIAMGVALNVIAGAVAILGTMELSTLVQGLIGIAAAMLILVLAVRAFPDEGQLLATAAAMLIMSVAINIMAGSIAILGNMGMGDLIQGLIGLAAALLIITIAMAAMSGVTAGAVGMIIAAGAIMILATALNILGNMSIASIITAILAIAIALAVITIAAILIQPALPALFGLASALLALGIAGALFGVAAILIASAIGILATGIRTLVEVGVEGAVVFAEVMPKYAEAVAKAIVAIVTEIANALPGIIAKLGEAVGALLQVLIDNMPKFLELIGNLISGILGLLREKVPEFIDTGLELLLALLTGIADNIGEITNAVVDIITNFLNALASRMGDIVSAGMNLLSSFLQGIADNIGKVIDSVGDIIVAFIDGLAEQNAKITEAGKNFIISWISGFATAVADIVTAVADLIVLVLTSFGESIDKVLEAGKNFVVTLLQGMAETTTEIADAMTDLIVAFITAIDTSAQRVIDAGTDFVVNFINGISAASQRVIDAMTNLVVNLLNSVNASSEEMLNAGVNLVISLITGLSSQSSRLIEAAVTAIEEFVGKLKEEETLTRLTNAGVDFFLAFLDSVKNSSIRMVEGAFQIVTTFLRDLATTIKNNLGELHDAGMDLAEAIIDGITMYDIGDLWHLGARFVQNIMGGAKEEAESHSPSKLFMRFAGDLVAGVVIGLNDSKPAVDAAKDLVSGVHTAMQNAAKQIEAMPEFQPTITPVLDLTNIKAGAKTLSSLVDTSAINPSVSFQQASAIVAMTAQQDTTTSDSATGTTKEIQFTQINNSPEALTTKEIYRQTKAGLALVQNSVLTS